MFCTGLATWRSISRQTLYENSPCLCQTSILCRSSVYFNSCQKFPPGGTAVSHQIKFNVTDNKLPEHIFSRPVARGPQSGLDLGWCFLGESGLFCMLFGRKLTILCTFWEKVDFFVRFLRVGGPFYLLFGRKRTFLRCHLRSKGIFA